MHIRRQPSFEQSERAIVEDAMRVYMQRHTISARHPECSDLYQIPASLLTPTVADALSRKPGGGHYFRTDVEVAFDVENVGWEWRLEIALLTATTPSPGEAFRMRRRVLLSVVSSDGETEIIRLSDAMRGFSDALGPMLNALASGQFA